MKILGLILELNPFHHGHAYFIDKAIATVKPDLTIAVLSTNFSMRGEIMLNSKWERARLLNKHGIDIVLELPYLATVGSADYFCYNAVAILNKMKVNHLAFGVELDDINLLNKMKDLQNSDAYEALIKNYLTKGSSYSGASMKAIMDLTKDEVLIENFSLPNNTLALGYLKALDLLNAKMEVSLIKRIANQYYDTSITDELYNSATALRQMLKENKSIKDYIAYDVDFYNPSEAEAKLYYILKYLFLVNEPKYFVNILGVDEGIENRFAQFIKTSNTYDEFIKNVQTRRYSVNRIKRLILNIVLNIPKEYREQHHFYLRLLSLNKQGEAYITKLDKQIRKEIFSSFKNNDNYIVKTELKASKLYSLLVGGFNLYLNEYLSPKGDSYEN